jgi:ferritin
MHYLTLDTNTWIYLANGTEPARLLTFIKHEMDKHNITILLPEIVINEWEKNKDKAVKQGGLKHYKDVNEALERIQKLLGDKGDKDYFNFLLEGKEEKDYFTDFVSKFKGKKKEIEDAIADNIKLIDDLFKHKSTVVIKIKNEIFIKAGQFALEKKAPFRNRNSFADALIVFSFLDFVKIQAIEGALFISYNTDDFCEKHNGEKYLHPDLDPEFAISKSNFYKIVGEALNTIEKDIISKEELEFIKEQQEEAERERDIEYCQVCYELNDRYNEVYFGRPQVLVDERIGLKYANPNQIELKFAKGLAKAEPEKHYDKIQVGHCSWCNTEHFICVNCGSLNAVWDTEYSKRKECEGCELAYLVDLANDHDHIGEPEYRILKDTETCEKCGNEFENDGSGSNICENCEDEYAYGVN